MLKTKSVYVNTVNWLESLSMFFVFFVCQCLIFLKVGWTAIFEFNVMDVALVSVYLVAGLPNSDEFKLRSCSEYVPFNLCCCFS